MTFKKARNMPTFHHRSSDMLIVAARAIVLISAANRYDQEMGVARGATFGHGGRNRRPGIDDER